MSQTLKVWSLSWTASDGEGKGEQNFVLFTPCPTSSFLFFFFFFCNGKKIFLAQAQKNTGIVSSWVLLQSCCTYCPMQFWFQPSSPMHPLQAFQQCDAVSQLMPSSQWAWVLVSLAFNGMMLEAALNYQKRIWFWDLKIWALVGAEKNSQWSSGSHGEGTELEMEAGYWYGVGLYTHLLFHYSPPML